MHFFALALGAFGHADIWEIQDSFFAADFILGCAFILIVYLTAVRLFGRTPHGACAFLFLCAAPYMNFFLGYVEIYSFSLTALALFAYLALLVTEEKFPFPLLCAYGMFLVFVSYLNGLAWISIGYLGIAEYRKGNRPAALAGAGVSAALSLGILALADFDMTALVDQSPISHFLSVSADVSLLNEYSQAFTLFSWNHAVEVANYLALMSPFAVPVVAALAWDRPSRLAATPFTAFLAIVGASYLLLLAVVKIQQGMANDWDVMASFFYFIGLYLMVLLREGGLPSRDRAALLVLSMTFIHTLIYVRLNSTVEPKIRRIESFYDTAMISQLGHYTISLHLSRYYDSRGDSVSPVALWTRYSSFFPDDPRGYSNALDYLKSLPAPDADSVMAVYDRWYSRDPLNPELRREYASYCLAAGNAAFAAGANERARASYERAIRLDPRSAAAFNNLGSVLAEGGKTDSALAMFSKAVEIDPGYAAALYNLGQAYSDLGDRRRATDAMRRAAALGSAEAEEFLSATGKPAGGRHE
jgi:tetratricopeptide (TPR) repeat protein